MEAVGWGLDSAMRSSFQEAPWLLPSSLKVSETGWRECQGDDVAPPNLKTMPIHGKRSHAGPFPGKDKSIISLPAQALLGLESLPWTSLV